MSYGINDRVLRVDLTHARTTVESPGPSYFRTVFGGWGIIAHELLTSDAARVDALGPSNPLVFASGIATGADVPGSGRHAVGAKSPLTGGFGEADVGGFWGAELRFAGFDAVVVSGRAQTPVYLWIHNGEVEIRDARHLWGRPTGDVEQAIRDDLGDNAVRVAQCGVAGENLVRYACVMHDVSRAAGRCGLGAVMGSKNLKAIAVRGTEPPVAAEPDKVAEIREAVSAFIREHYGNFTEYGTSGNVARLHEAGQLPTRNFQRAVFDAYAKICGHRITDEGYLVGRDTCYGCPIACKRRVKSEGKYRVDPAYGGPEYETTAALGSVCEVDDLEAILYANQLCNAHGLDTISTGVTIAWAMEAFDRGLLTVEDTGGMEIRFGDADVMVQLVEAIAHRDGFGDLLAAGSLRAARAVGRGTEAFAVQVRGQEAPMHDPRVKFALGIGYATSPTGADHMHNIHDTRYESDAAMARMAMLGIQEKALAFNDLSPKKVRLAAYEIAWSTFQNCLGLCMFTPYGRERSVELIRAVTGWDVNLFELMKAGERVLAMSRLFNTRTGQTPADDRNPPRFFEPLQGGPHDGSQLDAAAFTEAIDLYYEMMGWSKRSGAPTRAKLYELGLDEWVEVVE